MYHILVVDDESRIRAIIRKYAEFEGHKVTEATDGMDAVYKCRENTYDMIIMDIMMPELDGFSACREIRKITQTPIIMLSARGEEYDKINGFELGVDDYVVKPFSPKELMLRIEAVLKRVGRNAEQVQAQQRPQPASRTFYFTSSTPTPRNSKFPRQRVWKSSPSWDRPTISPGKHCT